MYSLLYAQKQKKAGAPKKKKRGKPNLTGQKLKFILNEKDIFGNLFHDDTVQIPSHPLAVNFCSVCLSGVFKNASSNTIYTVLHVNALSIFMIFSQSRRNSKNSY